MERLVSQSQWPIFCSARRMAKSLQYFDELSIWELGHRWEGIEPDATIPASPPSVVRERLREILIAVHVHLNVLDEDGYEILDYYVPVIRTTVASPSLAKLRAAARKRIYDKARLDRVYVRRREVRKWCLMTNIDLPTFWFAPDEIEEFEEERQRIFGDKGMAGEDRDERCHGLPSQPTARGWCRMHPNRILSGTKE